MRSLSPALALRQARQQLLAHGECPPGAVSERLAHSWRRSLAAGLLPSGRPGPVEHLSSGVLRQTLSHHHVLLAHSRPVMEYLFEQVRHSQSVVVLADPRGTLMHTLGDAEFLGKAERVALACGASWHEEQRGTNAIGTALAERGAVQIHGAEHFMERNGFLTCAASPIFSATGDVMGILDISGDHRSGSAHTLGLVSTAARMIENRLLVAGAKRGLRLHLHAQPEGIGTVAEGIVALSDDGWIVGANRAALGLLRLTLADVGSRLLEQLVETPLQALRMHHQRRAHLPMALRLRNGATVFAQVHADVSTVGTAVTSSAASGVPLVDVSADTLAHKGDTDTRWQAAAAKARKVFDKAIPVLIQGESGVGKELFARALHASSTRHAAPFVAINCAAIAESLVEAELFGYTGGAFTGARKEGSLGRLREAQGGTVFLDEIGDMPLALQTRLLRVLQERKVTPVGSGKAVDVDFALVCATHCKLREAAEAGRFREDLYYRINGMTVQLPALRERDDFYALTQRLLQDAMPGGPPGLAVAPDLLARLARYAWPGNVRQYANLLRTATAMLEPGEDCIGWQHLPDDLQEILRAPASLEPHGNFSTAANPVPGLSPNLHSPHNLQALSQLTIQQAVESSRGNLSQAAKRLGISRQTLYRKLAAQSAALSAPSPPL